MNEADADADDRTKKETHHRAYLSLYTFSNPNPLSAIFLPMTVPSISTPCDTWVLGRHLDHKSSISKTAVTKPPTTTHHKQPYDTPPVQSFCRVCGTSMDPCIHAVLASVSVSHMLNLCLNYPLCGGWINAEQRTRVVRLLTCSFTVRCR